MEAFLSAIENHAITSALLFFAIVAVVAARITGHDAERSIRRQDANR